MLKTNEGHDMGCLSIADDLPKILSREQVNMLEILSKWIVQIIGVEADIKLLNNRFSQTRNNATEELEEEIQRIFQTWNKQL